MTDPPYRWDDGWVLSHEGGGCSAWRRWFPGGYVLIGDGDWGAPSIEGYRPRPDRDRDLPVPDAFVAALAALEVEVVVAVYLATPEGDWAWEEGAVPEGLVPLREALAHAEAAAKRMVD